MKRLVLGKIYEADDTPWLNTRGYIQLLNNSYTNLIQYPENKIFYITDTLGNIKNSLGDDLFLWCNEEGNIESKFRFFLPSGKYFDFTVPVGTSPIELSVLRENINSSQPGYQSIVNYVDTEIQNVQTGSTQIYSNNLIAANSLSAGRLVNLQTGNYAQLSELSGCFGLTVNAVNQGEIFKALVYGSYQTSVSYEINKNLYLSNNGQITQIPDLENNILEIGKVINTQNIFINCCEVINVTTVS